MQYGRQAPGRLAVSPEAAVIAIAMHDVPPDLQHAPQTVPQQTYPARRTHSQKEYQPWPFNWQCAPISRQHIQSFNTLTLDPQTEADVVSALCTTSM